MMNANSSRPEPREPRAEPRPEPRTPTPRAAEAKAAEPRAPEARTPEVRVPEPAPRASVLGPTLRFRGELSAQEDLIVQGSVEGSITHTQSLTIGTDGSMKGDIRARVIVIDGKVEGDLYATESVSIRATAKVKGNVFRAARRPHRRRVLPGAGRDAAFGRRRSRAQCSGTSGRIDRAAAGGGDGGSDVEQRHRKLNERAKVRREGEGSPDRRGPGVRFQRTNSSGSTQV